MTHPVPKFQEEFSAKIPALTLLTQLGWTFLPPSRRWQPVTINMTMSC